MRMFPRDRIRLPEPSNGRTAVEGTIVASLCMTMGSVLDRETFNHFGNA
jgi:hypothetical protein